MAAGRPISPPPLKRKPRDEISEGAIPSPHKRPKISGNHLRVISWNVNGIQPLVARLISSFFQPRSSSSAPLTKLRAFLKRHDWPRMLCLQEVKLRRHDTSGIQEVRRAVNSDSDADRGPSYSVEFCLPTDKFNVRGFGGKMYGVASIIRDDFLLEVDHTREVTWDKEGRVLVTETKSKLAIFNIYAVNGTESPYRDPDSGRVVGTRHDRKREFHSLLQQECLDLERRGVSVILVGDMNISQTTLDSHPYLRTGEEHVKNRADFKQKLLAEAGGLKLVDTFRHLHGNQKKYSYYPRTKPWGSGCDRVDLILVSQSLAEASGLLQEAEILDNPEDRGPSDHVPLYIILDADKVATVEQKESGAMQVPNSEGTMRKKTRC